MIKKLLIAALAACTLAGCSGTQTENDGTVYNPDMNPSDLGRSQAKAMVEGCSDTMDVQHFLLEVHAQACELRQQRGENAAREYREGFEDEVRELNPDLAARIFD